MKNKIILLILVILNISCTSQTKRPVSPYSFLTEIYETRNFLIRSLSTVPEGAYLKTPPERVTSLDVNWPGEALITSVEQNQPWKSNAHYDFVIDINDTELFKYNENDSYRMTGAILLDHYFAGLEDMGFAKAGEPHTQLFYPVQYISNTWFRKNSGITVVGSIYINVEYKNALVTADVSESYE